MRRFMAILLCAVMLCGMAAADELPFVVRNGDRDKPYIAITVDDCFDKEYARKIFELCVSYNVPVTFFPLGNQLKQKDADLWQAMAASPLVEIGSHTQNHTSWKNMHRDGINMHVYRFQESLDAVLGYHYQIKSLRPPYGHTSGKNVSQEGVKKILARYDIQHVILWDVSQTNASKAIKQVKNGSILLYHARKKDYNCLVKLIPMLLEKGFVPVTVSTLLGFGDIATSTDIYVHE